MNLSDLKCIIEVMAASKISAEEETMELKDVLFNEQLRAGGRTYFLDVKQTKEGAPYLSIREARKRGNGMEQSRLLVFQDHLDNFMKALKSVHNFMESQLKSPSTRQAGRPTPVEEREPPF